MLVPAAIALTIVAVIAALVAFHHSLKNRNALRELELSWGKPKKDNFFFNQICKHAVATRTDDIVQLPDQVLNDSDFYDLFRYLDRTTSKPGQQYFFTKLIRPLRHLEPLFQFDQRVRFFSDNSDARLKIQSQLQNLASADAYLLTSLLREHLLERPKWYPLALMNVVVMVILFAASFQSPAVVFGALVPLMINFFIHYWNKTNMLLFARALPQLGIMVSVAKHISPLFPLHDKQSVQESIDQFTPFQRKLGLLGYGGEGSVKDDMAMIAGYLIELVKAAFLIEFFMLFHVVSDVNYRRKHVLTLFNFIGETDAAISVASIRASGKRLCTPELHSEKKRFTASKIYHPLIRDCVENNIRTEEKSILISGSNMSGKTTFIRTVLINSILAQTIYTCFAMTFKSPFFHHFSSIIISDDILEGKSYYFEEVTVVGSLVKEVRPHQCNLFILDEVFKGTNSLERISAAKAILSYLNRNDNLVIVSTHDMELTALLADEYDLYHFTEVLEDNVLRFDHRIKPGPLKTRNAIRMLELSSHHGGSESPGKEIFLSIRFYAHNDMSIKNTPAPDNVATTNRQLRKWFLVSTVIATLVVGIITDFKFGQVYFAENDEFFRAGALRAILYLAGYFSVLGMSFSLAGIISKEHPVIALLGSLVTPVIILFLVFLIHERWLLLPEATRNSPVVNQLMMIALLLVTLVAIEIRLITKVRGTFLKSSP